MAYQPPVYRQGGGRATGPYRQGGGRAVGPYRPAPLPPSPEDRHATIHNRTPIKPGLAKAIARTGKALTATFSTGVHKPAPRRGKPVPDVSPTKPADANNRKPAVHLAPVKPTPRYNAPVQASGFGQQLSRVLGQAFGSLINPAKYARSAADAQYAGLISDLATQISHAPTDEAQHHADINSWFGRATGTAKKSALDIANTGNDIVAGSDSSIQNLINSLGAGSAGSIGAQGIAAGTQLRGTTAADADFANNLATSMAEDQAFQQRQESNRSANNLSDLRSQLTKARLQRGNAYATALSQAQGQRFTQLGQLQNMLLGQQLAGPQYAAAALANQVTRQNLRAGDLAYQTGLAQLQDFQNKVNNPQGTFASLQAPDRAKLSDLLSGMFIGKGGRLRQAPKTVGKSVRNYLYNTVGYEKSPETEAFANSVTNSVLTGGSGVKRNGRGLTRQQEYRIGHRRG